MDFNERCRPRSRIEHTKLCIYKALLSSVDSLERKIVPVLKAEHHIINVDRGYGGNIFNPRFPH